ncbi:MAG: hypothetical protein LUH15_08075 [Tannerellaceae bacterium]|nr:hypothetical protein [Tannerellaceae bacterium]
MDELLKAFTCKTIYIEPIFISSSSLDGIEQYNREHNSSFGESGKRCSVRWGLMMYFTNRLVLYWVNRDVGRVNLSGRCNGGWMKKGSGIDCIIYPVSLRQM